MKHTVKLTIADMANMESWEKLLFQLDVVGTIVAPDTISMTVDALFLEVGS